jgi:hypothetical protein
MIRNGLMIEARVLDHVAIAANLVELILTRTAVWSIFNEPGTAYFAVISIKVALSSNIGMVTTPNADKMAKILPFIRAVLVPTIGRWGLKCWVFGRCTTDVNFGRKY